MIRNGVKLKNFICLMGVVIIVALCFLTGCDPYRDTTKTHRLIYTEEFIFQIREEENRAVLIDITETGGQKEVLKVPAYVEDFLVEKIGLQTTFYGGNRLKGDKVKKMYLPYTTRFVLKDLFVGMSNLHELVAVFNYVQEISGSKYPEYYSEDHPMDSLQGSIKSYVYTQSHYNKLEILPPLNMGATNFELPNYIFNFNYPDSPNEGIYWIDRVTDDNLKLLPDDPIREGYEFGGWYLDEYCQTKWIETFDMADSNNNQLYAKWLEL